MTTPDVKKIIQRLERVEKQNRRYRVLNVFVFFLFLCFMVAPQLSAISVPSLDPLWDSIRRIDDFIDFESDMKSKKFVAQDTSINDKPRAELSKDALEFHHSSGYRLSRLDNDMWSIYGPDKKRTGYLCIGSGGKIGINTCVGERALHVTDKNTMVQLRLQRKGSATGIAEIGTANDNLYFYPGGYNGKDGNVIFDTTGRVGIGVHSPQYRLHVNGKVKANNINTGDIVFQKDGQKLWRMFEDEHGLYLESMKTKKVYSFVLKEVK